MNIWSPLVLFQDISSACGQLVVQNSVQQISTSVNDVEDILTQPCSSSHPLKGYRKDGQNGEDGTDGEDKNWLYERMMSTPLISIVITTVIAGLGFLLLKSLRRR